MSTTLSKSLSKPLPAPLVELRFLVPPAFVEAARQAVAPYVLASVLPEGVSRHPAVGRDMVRPLKPLARSGSAGVTQKELEVLLRG